jgi:predicted DNA-binding transcriptional regulator YafY
MGPSGALLASWDMPISRTIEINLADSSVGLGLGPRPSALRLPLARLLQLLMILQSERFPNARRLAEACEVSRRTIYRDLAILEAAGIDVLYHPERQGYQLASNCWLQPTQLEDSEALALLILSRTSCVQAPFGLTRVARSGLAKVVQSLPGELRGRIAISSELIADDAQALEPAPDRQVIHETMLRALSQRRRLSLWHREHDSGSVVLTKLSLYRLARIQGRWCLVGHSSAERQVRNFEMASIERLELTDEPYSIPPRFRLERFLEKSRPGESVRRHEVRLRFTSHVAPEVRETPRYPGQRLVAGLDGTADLFLVVERIDELVPWVIGFGEQVEVLQPEELRNAVRHWAEQIARIYSGCDS